MKKLFLLSLLLAANCAFSQIDTGKSASKPDSKTQGFFVNNGSVKLTSIDCWTFKDLLISFDIDDSFFGYDRITVTLSRGASDGEKFTYSYSFTKEDFARRFKGKKYAFVNLFPEEGLDSKSVMDFSRVQLQMVGSKKDMENSKLFVNIYGGMATGEVETRYYNGEEIREPKYKDEKLSKLTPLPVSGLFKEPTWGQYPTVPKGDGNCYN